MKIALVTVLSQPISIAPLGSPYMTSVARQNDWEAITFAFRISGKLDEELHVVSVSQEAKDEVNKESVEAAVKALLSVAPDVIGVSCFASNRKSNSALLHRLREVAPHIKLVAGGPDIHPVAYEESGIEFYLKLCDYVVQGEGELKLPSILDEIATGIRHEIAGLFRKGEPLPQDLFEGYHTRVENLDEVPFPDHGDVENINLCRMDKAWWQGVPIYATRGCTGNCSFCNRNEYYKGIRWRSAESLYGEIRYQLERYNFDRFVIVDDDPLAKGAKEEFHKLAKMIIANGHDWKWHFYNARLRSNLVDAEFVGDLKKSGLEYIQFGVESFSENVRKDMGKGVNSEAIQNVLKLFHDAGINLGIYLIYGYPCETEADFQETVNGIIQYGDLLTTMNVNPFFFNDAYVKKRPTAFEWIQAPPEHPMACWKSKEVTPEILWKRYEILKETISRHYRQFYSLANPDGIYIRR